MNELLLALWLYQTWKLPEDLRRAQEQSLSILAPVDLTAMSAGAAKAAAQCATVAGFSL